MFMLMANLVKERTDYVLEKIAYKIWYKHFKIILEKYWKDYFLDLQWKSWLIRSSLT